MGIRTQRCVGLGGGNEPPQLRLVPRDCWRPAVLALSVLFSVLTSAGCSFTRIRDNTDPFPVVVPPFPRTALRANFKTIEVYGASDNFRRRLNSRFLTMVRGAFEEIAEDLPGADLTLGGRVSISFRVKPLQNFVVGLGDCFSLVGAASKGGGFKFGVNTTAEIAAAFVSSSDRIRVSDARTFDVGHLSKAESWLSWYPLALVVWAFATPWTADLEMEVEDKMADRIADVLAAKFLQDFQSAHTVKQAVVKPVAESLVHEPRPPASPPKQRWAVVVGISRYRDIAGPPDLAFADADAADFAHCLISQSGWRRDHIKLLTNEQATQRNVIIALESWLTKAGPADLIVLFWSGHGFPDPEDPEKVYFACYDTDVSIPATGYRMDRLRSVLEERNARNTVVLADTCHAGKLITRGQKGMAVASYVERLRRKATVPKGWIFMVGADTDRQAIEHSSWSNGAFTHCLLQGLAGKADGFQALAPRDGIVTMRELRGWMEAEMPEQTQRVLGVAKRAVITTSVADPHIWDLTLDTSSPPR